MSSINLEIVIHKPIGKTSSKQVMHKIDTPFEEEEIPKGGSIDWGGGNYLMWDSSPSSNILWNLLPDKSEPMEAHNG